MRAFALVLFAAAVITATSLPAIAGHILARNPGAIAHARALDRAHQRHLNWLKHHGH